VRRGARRLKAFPDIVAGRRVRCVAVELSAGLVLSVLEAGDADAVLDETIRDTGDRYAAVLWPSAIAAAARLPELVTTGSRVLDVGAGTGIVALAAACLGARASALDHNEFSRAVITAAAGAQSLPVQVIDFDVRDATPLPEAELVVMADLLYEPELARAAARRTLEALAAGCTVLVADPARYGRAEYERIVEDAGTAVDFSDVLVRVPGDARPSRVGVAVLGA
jgi:predicted nicotinamide N-methyase